MKIRVLRVAPVWRVRRIAWLVAIAWGIACGSSGPPPPPKPPPRLPDLELQEPLYGVSPGPDQVEPSEQAANQPPDPVEPEPELVPLAQAGPGEVAFWRRGDQRALITREQAEALNMVLLDVGRDWVPAMFRSTEHLPHDYEQGFTDLANGYFDVALEGDRARQDRYLELYGIPPSLALLARRFEDLQAEPCVEQLPLGALRAFGGVAWDEGGDDPAGPVSQSVVDALQARLRCEGHLRTVANGRLDLRTRRAIEEFERRNRIYARGSLLGETLDALQVHPLELERRSLVRVLTERLLLELGVIEDGSAVGAEPARARGPVEYAPNVVERVEEHVTRTFGLHSVEAVQDFYARMREVLSRPHYLIALDPIELPAYHRPAMDLFVEIDRGDVYYEFPFDAQGNRRDFPLEQGPTLTLFARVQRQVIPLARYRTTIGGWRVQRHRGVDVWTYKESPVGLRAWSRILSSPVWLPPAGVPPESLVLQTREDLDGELIQEVNRNLIGPGYASAYGLVAAYHQRASYNARDELVLGDDDGIRTHGSSDYTSIWQRASLGCHRLHNHLAIRLFNFILAHRQHRRLGHRPASYRMPVTLGDFSTTIEVFQTGYVFELAQPIPVEVLRGRIRGRLQRPLPRRIPVAEIESPAS